MEFRVDILVDDGIDAFAWCTCLPDLCHYDTKAGECLTSPQRLTTSNSPRRWSAADNLRRLIESGDEPLKVLVERCHIHGIAFAATIRMNDAHGGSYEFAYVASKFFLEHREWLIRDERGTPTVGMDYPIPEMRAHLSAILQEQAENYEIDGLELDFMRWPPFFQPQRWLENTPVLTRYVREIREMLDDAAAKGGRKHLFLGLRFPATLEECRDNALDFSSRTRLVDYVCPSDFIRPDFNMPVETFRKLTHGTKCRVFRTIFPGGVSKNYFRVLTPEQCRALANIYHKRGANGISTFNIHPGSIRDPHHMAFRGGGFAMIKEMMQPQKLRVRDRHCIILPLQDLRSRTGKVIDRRSLLDRRKDQGIRKSLSFRVMEDFGDHKWRDRFRFVASDETPLDKIRFDLNGKLISARLKSNVLPAGRLAYQWILGIPDVASITKYEMELDERIAVRNDNDLGAALVGANPELKFWTTNYLGPQHIVEVSPIVILELEVEVVRRIRSPDARDHEDEIPSEGALGKTEWRSRVRIASRRRTPTSSPASTAVVVRPTSPQRLQRPCRTATRPSSPQLRPLVDDLRLPTVSSTSATPSRLTFSPMSRSSTNYHYGAFGNSFFHVVNHKRVKRRSNLVTTTNHAPQGLGLYAARRRRPPPHQHSSRSRATQWAPAPC